MAPLGKVSSAHFLHIARVKPQMAQAICGHTAGEGRRGMIASRSCSCLSVSRHSIWYQILDQ